MIKEEIEKIEQDTENIKLIREEITKEMLEM